MNQSIYTWIISFIVIGGWGVGAVWGITPEIRKQKWGMWTDILLNGGFDAAVSSVWYFYAVPALNIAFTSEDKVNFADTTLNPDINLMKFMQMFGAVSAVAWAGRKTRRNKQAKKTVKKSADKTELMEALKTMVNNNSLE